MSNGTPTLSWQPPPRPVGSPLPRRRWRTPPWVDPELKVLIPVMVIVFVVQAIKFGLMAAHSRLRTARGGERTALRELFVTANPGCTPNGIKVVYLGARRTEKTI
ncbi:MAG: hypothetical protein MUP25_06485 [Syntrophales bacterium]|nr:hypothetical protein [Syntrophales bacterium]